MTSARLTELLTLADQGAQGAKSAAIRELVAEVERLQRAAAMRDRRAKFVPPILFEIKKEGLRIGLSMEECENFHRHYNSNGWKVGKVGMVSWVDALAQWKARRKRGAFGSNGTERQLSYGVG